ncbi:DUF397 domain-containing protein [Nocardia miyunensis]|uniref:DUF397 domain-containing protein n=1 Tax=Nocardia miyunensis TaxID=282684 RepID=UPI00082D7B40
MDDLANAMWFKSSHSGASQNCVEVAFLPKSLVGVRDSKQPSGPALVFTSDEWSAFVDATDRGRFDR